MEKDNETLYISHNKIKPSMITFITFLQGVVQNFDLIVAAIPVITKNSDTVLNGKRIKTFSKIGVKKEEQKDGIVVSARNKNYIKGNKGGCIDNLIIFDIWSDSKRVHCKISKDKINLVGSTDEKMAGHASMYCLRHIILTSRFLKYVYHNKSLFEKAIDYTCNYTRGDVPLEVPVYISALHEEKDIISYQKVIDWPDIENVPQELKKMLFEIYTRFSDLAFVLEIRRRANYILNNCHKEIHTPNIACTKMYHIMTVYHYSTGFLVNRKKLADFFFYKGFNSDYNNTAGGKVFVEIEPKQQHERFYRKNKKNKIPSARFTITKKGNIKHGGTGIKTMEESYNEFMNIFYNNREKFLL